MGGQARNPRWPNMTAATLTQPRAQSRVAAVVAASIGNALEWFDFAVYGFFALSFVTPTLLQDLLSMDIGFTNALAAGLVLGVMVIPTIASLAEDVQRIRSSPYLPAGLPVVGCRYDVGTGRVEVVVPAG